MTSITKSSRTAHLVIVDAHLGLRRTVAAALGGRRLLTTQHRIGGQVSKALLTCAVVMVAVGVRACGNPRSLLSPVAVRSVPAACV
jgi:hypothetical protein